MPALRPSRRDQASATTSGSAPSKDVDQSMSSASEVPGVRSSSGRRRPELEVRLHRRLEPDVAPGQLGEDPLLLEDVAVRLDRVAAFARWRARAPPGWAGARRRSQRAAASSSLDELFPWCSSQARYSRRSLRSSRAWPSSARMPVSRSSSRAWNRRLVTATRRRTEPAIRTGRLELDLVDREPEVVEPPDAGPDGVPIVRGELGHEMELVPDRFVPRADRLGGLDRIVEGVLATLQHAEVGQPECDVLDEDIEVVATLAVGQARVDLAGLGIDEERLDLVAVAAEQRVRERAVAPEHARPMEVDEQPRHRVEQPVPIRPGPEREPHHTVGTGSRTRGTRSSGWPTRAPATRPCPPPGPRAARAPRGGAGRRTRSRPTSSGSSFSAYVRSSATRNRTRWRDGPTGSSRNSNVSATSRRAVAPRAGPAGRPARSRSRSLGKPTRWTAGLAQSFLRR